jgi:transcriptional regulator GlxA family with amidase domain
MTSTRPRVVLLAAPETSASVLYGLYDVLLSVGPMWPDMTEARSGDALLDVSIVAATAEPFRCFGNIVVEPHAALADVPTPDVVVICDMYTPIDTPPTNKYPVETAWLRRVYEEGATVTTVCTGSVLLAEAGLLDGRSCAGHWAYADLFHRAYPKVRFRPGAILDLTHEPERLITGGGVTSWQDLALHLIGKLCGPEHAARTAKVYLLGSHEDGQLPFAAMTRLVQGEDRTIEASLAWIADHFSEANPVTAMAENAGLTNRTFARRFQAATGRRPIEYVHAVRVEQARQRLERGTMAVEDVGYEVGYEDPTFFRRLFRRTTGMTPAAYRRRYAAMATAASDLPRG